jgi:hypothetical protein
MPSATAGEVASSGMMKPGIRAGEIISAESKIGEKSGKEYIKVRVKDYLTEEKTNSNVSFSKAAHPFLKKFLASASLTLPADPKAKFLVEPRHVIGRTVYFESQIEDTPDYGLQVRLSWLTQEKAFQLRPELADANIPENQPFALPVVSGGEPPPPIVRKPGAVLQRPQAPTPEEQARQAAADVANSLHMQDKLDMPVDPTDDIPMDGAKEPPTFPPSPKA